MALIFSMNDDDSGGFGYDDRVGESDEFPSRYRNLVVEGDAFVYYRGRRKKDGGQQRQAYLGSGLVGPVSAAGDRLRCQVRGYRAFDPEVYFRRPDNSYFEDTGDRQNYWREGVRRINLTTYAEICEAGPPPATDAPTGAGNDGASPPPSPPPTAPLLGGRHAYPRDAELTLAVERYAVDVAVRTLAQRYPTAKIIEERHNNPGFDVRVGDDLFVEVKGTTQPTPSFYMTETERRFARIYADRYLLVVVHRIDLAARTHLVTERVGTLESASVAFEPLQWRGQLC